MEAAITARLERVVQEVIEVRQKARTLSAELEQVRAERGMLMAALEEERANLAAARVALEIEREKRPEHKPLPLPEPMELPVSLLLEDDEEPVQESETAIPRRATSRNLLDKLKFGRRDKLEDSATSTVAIVPIHEEEAAEVSELAPVTVSVEVQVEPELKPITITEVDASDKPKKTTVPRAAKPKKIAPPPRFAPREFLSSLPGLNDEQLDLATFGIAQLDDEGAIVALNHQGALLLGTDKSGALDQALFTALLPAEGATTCFIEGVTAGKLDSVLRVEGGLVAHLFRHTKSRTNWALLRKTDGEEA